MLTIIIPYGDLNIRIENLGKIMEASEHALNEIEHQSLKTIKNNKLLYLC